MHQMHDSQFNFRNCIMGNFFELIYIDNYYN